MQLKVFEDWYIFLSAGLQALKDGADFTQLQTCLTFLGCVSGCVSEGVCSVEAGAKIPSSSAAATAAVHGGLPSDEYGMYVDGRVHIQT